MKANEVLKLLKISRQTLCHYVKIGKINVSVLPSGFFDYNKESVFKLLNKNLERTNVVYCRVSTQKQKNDLETQKETVLNYCNNNGIKITKVYLDIGSGLNFDRKEFQEMLLEVINFKIDKIFVTYKDRFSRISFNMFKELFKKFHCEIIVLNDTDNEKLIEKEIFKEIIDLIHCFSMKVYSSRRKEKLRLVKKDLSLEVSES